jgi:class 3 adenylate cyclase
VQPRGDDTRLAERLEAGTVNRLVERYFGAFLDEIVDNGGDVNETAGDGLMVIFQDADPRRHSARPMAQWAAGSRSSATGTARLAARAGSRELQHRASYPGSPGLKT